MMNTAEQKIVEDAIDIACDAERGRVILYLIDKVSTFRDRGTREDIIVAVAIEQLVASLEKGLHRLSRPPRPQTLERADGGPR